MKNRADQPLRHLGGLTPREFLADYWQKKPLFVKGAFPDFKDPLTPDTIAGLSLEEFIPSRLILEEGGVRPWEMRKGPLAEEIFSNLGEKKWMLVVNDMEKFLPHLRLLTDPFNFIPNWRFDDLQATLGPDEGNVGAHWDDYDVFLIQGMGKKHWKISFDEVSEDDFVEGIDIRLIEDFNVDQEWIVEPGDLLYLPPRIGHYGVNIGKSITWSVGFRAPKDQELVHDFAAAKMELIEVDARFSDPDLIYQQECGELTDQSVDKVLELLKSHLPLNRETVGEWFGRFITEPKMGQEAYPLDEPVDLEFIEELLEDEQDIERNPGLTFIYRVEGDVATLYVAGEAFAVSADLTPLLALLTRYRFYSPGQLRPYLKETEASALLVQLLNEGYLVYEGLEDEYDEYDDEEYDEDDFDGDDEE